MSDHADTALDQLKVADDLATTREHMFQHALVAAQVHAQLAMAEAVRKAGLALTLPPGF